MPDGEGRKELLAEEFGRQGTDASGSGSQVSMWGGQI